MISNDDSIDQFVRDTTIKKKNYMFHNAKQYQKSCQCLASESMRHTDCACSIFPCGSTVLRVMCRDSKNKSRSSTSDSKDEKDAKKKRNIMLEVTIYS